jgi:carbamoyl-phosphate synthase large subunit
VKQYNVLVTSIGGDLGKAVCKSLRYSHYNIKITGTDCKTYIPYPLFCNNFEVIPRADSKDFLNSLCKITHSKSIDLIYICSEQELLYIADHFYDFDEEVRDRIVIPPLEVINICRDKFKTIKMLKDNFFPYPHSVLFDELIPKEELLKDFNYPFVVKKITDCGSKHLHIVQSHKELENITDLDSSYIIQDYIPGTEYTNGVFRDAFSNEIYVLTLERTMKDGMSDEVKVIFDKEIEELCKKVAEKLNITGSINIQLRKRNGLPPMIFEINPRYSSTSFMRAKFGFNDVIYAFENMVLKKAVLPPKIRAGEAYRYITEYYRFY